MDDNCNCKKDIAALIKEYLKKHPSSEDTILGITDWWVKRQILDSSIIDVDRALKKLESDGDISSESRNEQVYFRLEKK